MKNVELEFGIEDLRKGSGHILDEILLAAPTMAQDMARAVADAWTSPRLMAEIEASPTPQRFGRRFELNEQGDSLTLILHWYPPGTSKQSFSQRAKDYISPRWAFMRRRIIGKGGNTYLDRMYVLSTPWFQIMFHRIFRPDGQRDLHDHPWNFLSLVLRGWYKEDTPKGMRKVYWFNWKRATDFHSIRWTSRSPVWTLVFTGRKRRTWGFQTERGWVKWTDYEKLEDA